LVEAVGATRRALGWAKLGTAGMGSILLTLGEARDTLDLPNVGMLMPKIFFLGLFGVSDFFFALSDFFWAPSDTKLVSLKCPPDAIWRGSPAIRLDGEHFTR
jgi:hypothetical protein